MKSRKFWHLFNFFDCPLLKAMVMLLLLKIFIFNYNKLFGTQQKNYLENSHVWNCLWRQTKSINKGKQSNTKNIKNQSWHPLRKILWCSKPGETPQVPTNTTKTPSAGSAWSRPIIPSPLTQYPTGAVWETWREVRTPPTTLAIFPHTDFYINFLACAWWVPPHPAGY